MNDWTLALKAAVAVPLAAVGSVLGGSGFLVIFFVAAALIDWLTGTMKAMKSGSWTSATARNGLWHKTGEVVSILVAAGLDLLVYYLSVSAPALNVNYTACLLPVVCVWYICTELGSILENIGELGAPIPKFLCRMIEVLKGQAEEDGNALEEGVRIEK